MSKKNCRNLLTTMVIVVLSVCLISCGKDDEENSGSIPKESQPFVGMWKTSPNSGHNKNFPEFNIFFFSDGICGVISSEYGASWDNPATLHSWSYDHDKEILSIVEGLDNSRWAQWAIIAQNEDSWVGHSLWLSNQEVYTAKKVHYDNEEDELLQILQFHLRNFKWENRDGQINRYNSGSNRYYIEREQGNISIEYMDSDYKTKVEITEDKKNDAIILTHIEWIWEDTITVNNEIRLVHPYSSTNNYLEITIWDYSSNKGQEYSGTFKHD